MSLKDVKEETNLCNIPINASEKGNPYYDTSELFVLKVPSTVLIHYFSYILSYPVNSSTYTRLTLSKELSHNPSYSDNSVHLCNLTVSFLRNASSNSFFAISPTAVNISF